MEGNWNGIKAKSKSLDIHACPSAQVLWSLSLPRRAEINKMTIGINCLVLLCDLQLNCVHKSRARTKEKLLRRLPHLRFALRLTWCRSEMMEGKKKVFFELSIGKRMSTKSIYSPWSGRVLHNKIPIDFPSLSPLVHFLLADELWIWHDTEVRTPLEVFCAWCRGSAWLSLGGCWNAGQFFLLRSLKFRNVFVLHSGTFRFRISTLLNRAHKVKNGLWWSSAPVTVITAQAGATMKGTKSRITSGRQPDSDRWLYDKFNELQAW